MKKLKIGILVFVILALLAGLTLFLIGYFKPKGAEIRIESSPAATVYIDGEQIGKTPYISRFKAGEVTVKLVPESFAKPLAAYETKVVLTPGITTFVSRVFAESEEDSAGEIISFEKTGSENASLAVISNPDASTISLDGQTRGFTPLKISSVSPGKHELTVGAQGFKSRSFPIIATENYRLTSIVKLSVDRQASPSASPTPMSTPKAEEKKTLEIEVLNTPTGFLRVRSEPSTSSPEIAKVKPGEKFTVIEINDKSDWYKIEYLPAAGNEKAKAGWVSAEYLKKLGIGSSPSPSPTPKI